MKFVQRLVVLSALSMISFGSFAQSITASASTLDGAESKIALQAKQRGMHYKIIEAGTKNRVHMTAELYK